MFELDADCEHIGKDFKVWRNIFIGYFTKLFILIKVELKVEDKGEDDEFWINIGHSIPENN